MRITAALILSVILLLSCSKTNTTSILGKWTVDSSLVYTADGEDSFHINYNNEKPYPNSPLPYMNFGDAGTLIILQYLPLPQSSGYPSIVLVLDTTGYKVSENILITKDTLYGQFYENDSFQIKSITNNNLTLFVPSRITHTNIATYNILYYLHK
jgi:hypothetical protein